MPKDTVAKLSVEDLHRKIVDLGTPEEELARYFLLDEDASTPMRPALALNPETVEVPPESDAAGRARSAELLNGANFVCRLRREARYSQMIARGYSGPRVAAEGDSWFQYPFILKDVIDWVFDRYAVYCRSEAGDTLENMVRRAEFLDALEHTGGRILLLSGGGNDMVAGGNLAQHLRPFDPALEPAQYLLPSFGGILDTAIGHIEQIVRAVDRAFPQAKVITHGYDYAVPHGGKWLGKPMASLGIDDPALQAAITAEMVNRWNTRLRTLAAQSPRVTYLDCRKVVGAGRWHDELHPVDAGYGDVAKRFGAAIAAAATGTREAPPLAGAAGVAGKLRARRRAKLPTRPESAVARGYALHVGLNAVDPGAYEGWSGELTACEFDARDMETLAKAVGFETKSMMTAEATRDAVIGHIRATAAAMNAGDIFLLTYSGHGGQVPDFDGDEALDRPDDFMDETLCLHDGQLIDDELYALWSEFPADSRVLVITDCCHSGTNVKSQMLQTLVATDPPPEARPRAMPLAVASRIARAQKAFYREISRAVTEAYAGPVTREMARPVAASVRLIAACQDNQLALDGLANGVFTARLLETWGEGAFQGNYAAFHRAIADRMPDSESPNHYPVGQPSPAYDAQRPFDI